MTSIARARVRRLLAVPAAAAILAGAAMTATGLFSAPRASALTDCPTLTVSPTAFGSTGQEQCFTVPANVGSIHAVLVGGSGAMGDQTTDGTTAGAGGHGARVSADLTVHAGEVIYVEAGGPGQAGGDTENNGGFNGGAAGSSVSPIDSSGGGGGGATDLRTVSATLQSCDGGTDFAGGAASLSSRVLVAGGGGGGGNPSTVPGSSGADGGAGGATPGAGSTPTVAGGTGGGAGTGSAGGAGGAGDGLGHNGDAGTSGCGGDGGTGGDRADSGGGGGGGYWGGGGGGGGCDLNTDTGQCLSEDTAIRVASLVVAEGGGGGGAGSNYADPALTSNVSIVTDAPAAPVTITWTATAPAATPTPTPSPAATSAPLITPSTGAGGPTLDLGFALLAAGAILLCASAAGRRRTVP